MARKGQRRGAALYHKQQQGDMGVGQVIARIRTEATSSTRCFLLELPDELQIYIYELAVVHETAIRVADPACGAYEGKCPELTFVWDDHKDPSWELCSVGARRYDQRLQQPALLSTCHEIRAIALPIFYGLNTFESCSCDDSGFRRVRTWLLTIGEENRKLMKKLYSHDVYDNPSEEVEPNEGPRSMGLRGFGSTITRAGSRLWVEEGRYGRYTEVPLLHVRLVA
ncbi:hypothetical protein LTS10_007174 [Elasticomyces elasticus]|nr:hypothetical protein LTS10_007174 [Elasticomyces elasticus]